MKVLTSLVILAFCVSVVLSRATFHPASIPEDAIEHSYMVVLHPGTTLAARDAHIAEVLAASPKSDSELSWYSRVTYWLFPKYRPAAPAVKEEISHRYSFTVIGYAARLNKESVARLLENPLVAWVEEDALAYATEEPAITQPNVDPAAWGLIRSDQRGFAKKNTYTYWASSGRNVDLYIIDTGILLTHQDFTGRATFGFNGVGDGNNADCNGHGTHVASSAGGVLYGLAKNAHLIAVKVLNCGGSGSWAGVVAGIDWVTGEHTKNPARPSVANMSLGGGATATVDEATTRSVAAGVVHAVAAGNNNANACSYSPARAPTALTVGSTQQVVNSNPAMNNTDSRSSFSNFGPCTKIFAPGTNIKAAWIGNPLNQATNTISGTSMASPHVAGAVAVFYGHQLVINEKLLSPAEIEKAFQTFSTHNAIPNAGVGSPNFLLYSPYSYPIGQEEM